MRALHDRRTRDKDRPDSSAAPRNTRFRAAAALVTLAVAAAVTATGGPAGAAPNTHTAGDEHCVLDTGSGVQECFDTFPEAMSAASGGRISQAPESGQLAASDTDFREQTRQLAADDDAVAQGEVIQGTFFDDTNYGGDSLTVRGEAPCVKDGWVDWELTLDDDWKDRISSLQPWANCWIWLYPEPDLGGDRDGPFKENTADIGSYMNDRAQSIGFS